MRDERLECLARDKRQRDEAGEENKGQVMKGVVIHVKESGIHAEATGKPFHNFKDGSDPW